MGKLKSISVISLLILILMSFVSVHEYYVSITNININKEESRLEVEVKLDAEDFEKVLSQKHGTVVNFDVVDEKEKEYISTYLSNHLTFFINGGNRKIKLIGEELNPDGEFWCYFTVEIPEEVHSIKVKNNLLLPTFLLQHNIVNLKSNGIVQSHTFITKHTTHIFKIDAN